MEIYINSKIARTSELIIESLSINNTIRNGSCNLMNNVW